mgnify:CR=1 FL=1
MIIFEKLDKRLYSIKSDDTQIIESKLIFSPATNKYQKLHEFVEDCSVVMGKEFDDWFIKYLTDYDTSENRFQVMKSNIPEIKKFVDRYIEAKEIDFENYINRDKISKNSIFFDSEEIKEIIKTSGYLKLYFIMSQDASRSLPIRFHREIYQNLTQSIKEKNILLKLFKIVSSKTYKYNMTDSYMWEYIRMIYCKTTDMHIMTIFNFIVNNILVTCESTTNPISYIITVIDESIKWILQSVYKDVVIYSDTINTEDVYALQGKDNLKAYAYDDTIGRLVVAGYNCIDQEGIESKQFKEDVKSRQETALISKFVVYPILCKVLDIPYRHFLTVPAEHGYLLNILVYHNLPEEFKTQFRTLSSMMIQFNKEKSISKTTYKLKNVEHFANTFESFWGFKNLTFVYECYSSIVGMLSRNTYAGFRDNKELDNIPLAKLEKEIIEFYNGYFSDKFDTIFKKLGDDLESFI